MYIHKLLWYRGKHIRVFLSGDYEFLSRAYGISGASSTCKDCAIWTQWDVTAVSTVPSLTTRCRNHLNSVVAPPTTLDTEIPL